MNANQPKSIQASNKDSETEQYIKCTPKMHTWH